MPRKYRQIPTFKCVIVGDGECGKSAFIQRHLTGQFMEQYMPTYGITVIKLLFPTTRGPICFAMWEGGRAEYAKYPSNPFFKKIQCAILMFDVSVKGDPFKKFNTYGSMTNMISSRTLKIICGNKADGNVCKPNPLPTKIYRYIHMSVKTNMNTLLPFVYLSRIFLKDRSLKVTPRQDMLPAQVMTSRKERQRRAKYFQIMQRKTDTQDRERVGVGEGGGVAATWVSSTPAKDRCPVSDSIQN